MQRFLEVLTTEAVRDRGQSLRKEDQQAALEGKDGKTNCLIDLFKYSTAFQATFKVILFNSSTAALGLGHIFQIT